MKDDKVCEEFEIETKEEIKPDILSRYYKGTKAMFSSSLPELKPYNLKLNEYDRIIL